jgi:uncharacterized protein (TIGR01777 family)
MTTNVPAPKPVRQGYNKAIMRVAITGGTGLIGRALARRLLRSGHQVRLTGRREPSDLEPGVSFTTWDASSGPLPAQAVESADAIVHLAGESVAQRWTREARARIRTSRLEGTGRLIEALAATARRPATLISASAIGIYGDRGDEWLEEGSPPGEGFLAELARDWEQAAASARALGVRVVLLRIGIVLDVRGGALKRMLVPFRLGLGARLGSGRQWMSWIHLADLVELILFGSQHAQMEGPVNAVAPNPVTNAEFTQVLARTLRRPALLQAPAFLLRAALGEMADVLLASQRVRPGVAMAAGFRFRFPELSGALADLLAPAPR